MSRSRRKSKVIGIMPVANTEYNNVSINLKNMETMKIKSFVLFLFLSNFIIGQTEESKVNNKINFLENQLNLVQEKIKTNNLDSLYREFETLKTEKSQNQSIDLNLEKEINSLKGELSKKEKDLSTLQTTLTDLTGEINKVNENIKSQDEENAQAEKLAREAKKIKEKLTQQTIGKYKSDVRNFASFATLIDALAGTAENLLLFSESKSKEPFLITAGKYLGVAGGIAGAFIIPKDEEAGALTSTISLSVTTLLTTVFKKKENQQLIENISRNRGFTDEILSFAKASSSFKEKTSELYNKVKAFENNLEWRPNEQNLIGYYALTSLRRDLSVVLRQMKAKAEYLKSFESLTLEGTQKLVVLIEKYNDALDSWESDESVYRATYSYLKDLK